MMLEHRNLDIDDEVYAPPEQPTRTADAAPFESTRQSLRTMSEADRREVVARLLTSINRAASRQESWRMNLTEAMVACAQLCGLPVVEVTWPGEDAQSGPRFAEYTFRTRGLVQHAVDDGWAVPNYSSSVNESGEHTASHGIQRISSPEVAWFPASFRVDAQEVAGAVQTTVGHIPRTAEDIPVDTVRLDGASSGGITIGPTEQADQRAQLPQPAGMTTAEVIHAIATYEPTLEVRLRRDPPEQPVPAPASEVDTSRPYAAVAMADGTTVPVANLNGDIFPRAQSRPATAAERQAVYHEMALDYQLARDAMLSSAASGLGIPQPLIAPQPISLPSPPSPLPAQPLVTNCTAYSGPGLPAAAGTLNWAGLGNFVRRTRSSIVEFTRQAFSPSVAYIPEDDESNG